MNCTIDSPATQQGRIGGVYNRIHLQGCDVTLYYGDHMRTILQEYETGEIGSNFTIRTVKKLKVLFNQREVRSAWAGGLHRDRCRGQVLQHFRDHEVAMKSRALVSLARVQCQH